VRSGTGGLVTRRKTETAVEFTCIGTCDDAPCWMVEGRWNAEGEFEPTTVDEMGSDMDCPECGERGEPTDSDIAVADI
jgi:hypothetical protein